MKYNSSNIFQDLAFEYIYTVTHLSEYPHKRSLFKRQNYIQIPEEVYNGLYNQYYTIDRAVKDISDPSNFARYIIQYIEFLNTAEKCFLYDNSDNNICYSILKNNKDENSGELIIDNDLTRISVSYKDSYIEIPDEANGIIEDFLDPLQKATTLIFITIKVTRNTGSKSEDEIKFILGSNSSLKKTSDTQEIMVNNIFVMISEQIRESYFNILNNYLAVHKDNNITIEGILKSNGKLWLR